MSYNGPGTPMKIGGASSWRGTDRTNGFLMRNADGRIPAIQNSFADLVIDALSPFVAESAVPWGNALFVDQSEVETKSGVMHTNKPAVGYLAGVLKFDQGIQTGHPVQNWGLMEFGKGTRIVSGLIGYKHSMAEVGQETEYLAYLKGDRTQDVDTVRHTYADWMAAFAEADEGDRLALFFGNASGFPIFSIVPAGTLPVLADATFAGFAAPALFEPENEAVFVDLKTTTWHTEPAVTP